MIDKSQLGNRFTCYECGCRFYDLNRPEPLCPDCNADQRSAPARDIRALLGKGRKRPTPIPDEEPPIKKVGDDDDEDDDDNEDGDAKPLLA